MALKIAQGRGDPSNSYQSSCGFHLKCDGSGLTISQCAKLVTEGLVGCFIAEAFARCGVETFDDTGQDDIA